jgi:hypothetical protein
MKTPNTQGGNHRITELTNDRFKVLEAQRTTESLLLQKVMLV